MVWRVSENDPGIRPGPRKYQTYDDCNTDRESVMADFAKKNWSPFGAICWIDWGGISMDVYGPPTKK
jgi:hypothetical protein